MIENKKDIHLKLLRKIEENPLFTQRDLSKEMEVSLGKVNYCMKKLIDKGLVKWKIFSSNPNKKSYAYLLTSKGLEEKANLTIIFLKIKMREYELLKKEITLLKEDNEKINSTRNNGF